MTIRFTARHMEGGYKHEHIAKLRWIQDGTSAAKESTREELVKWIRSGGEGYVVDEEGDRVQVDVVNEDPPYLRTKKDDVLTDNLLELPTF